MCTYIWQVLGFDDCLEKIESVGNSVRVQGALEMLRELEAQNHLPKEEEETTESAARRLSDEMDDEVAGMFVCVCARAPICVCAGQYVYVDISIYVYTYMCIYVYYTF